MLILTRISKYLKNTSIYRDLSKPIGAIKSINISNLYESGYSNQYSVLFWLYRLEPFNTKRKGVQQNDDLEYSYEYSQFKSINDVFNDVKTKMNDYRELIPEFFFFPEFLISKEFGDVKLPPLANKSSIEFIYLHRKALESETVSTHLNEWIDLIWGYKQKSNEANNVFSPSMSELKLFNEKHPIKKLSCFTSSCNFELKSFKTDFICILKSIKSNKSYLFKLIDNKAIYFYSIDFSSIKSTDVTIKTNLIKNISDIKCEHDENEICSYSILNNFASLRIRQCSVGLFPKL